VIDWGSAMLMQSVKGTSKFLREVKGVEEQDNVLTLVVIEGDLLEGTINDGSGLEGGGNLSNRGNHDKCEGTGQTSVYEG